MPFELDHLFIFAVVGGPEADRLVSLGLTEGSGNVHPGQGTANRRFFFRNTMLELLWVADEREVRGEAISVGGKVEETGRGRLRGSSVTLPGKDKWEDWSGGSGRWRHGRSAVGHIVWLGFLLFFGWLASVIFRRD